MVKIYCMKCCFCKIICEDDDDVVFKQCEQMVHKGKDITQCKRVGINYDEFDKKFYCEVHFDVSNYMFKKYPSNRRNSSYKRAMFMQHLRRKIDEERLPNRTSLDLSLSSDDS